MVLSGATWSPLVAAEDYAVPCLSGLSGPAGRKLRLHHGSLAHHRRTAFGICERIQDFVDAGVRSCQQKCKRDPNPRPESGVTEIPVPF